MALLENQMDRRPDFFPGRPINLPELLGSSGDSWDKHFPKILRSEVDGAIAVLKENLFKKE
jgi:hypothetical protein